MRLTTFRYTLDPTPAQHAHLLRHAGAARFAYNQCLRLVKDRLDARTADPTIHVPWTRFDLINAFNAWKRSAAAGRVLVASPDGTLSMQPTGLAWRGEVCQQVFEEAAVDLARGLAAWATSRTRHHTGRAGAVVGFPRFKRKGRTRPGFRLRNKTGSGRASSRAVIRVGDGPARSVTLPVLGTIRVREDTRPLRRLLRPVPVAVQVQLAPADPTAGRQPDPDAPEAPAGLVARGRILHAAVNYHAGRWSVSLHVEAGDLHPNRQHPPHPTGQAAGEARSGGGWVGLDRGLTHLVVAATADRVEVGRWAPPRPLHRALPRLRRASRVLSRRQPGSARHATAARQLAHTHARIANQRRWWLHQVTTQLVQTHDRLVLETLAVANLARNHRLARAIADAAWAELARQLAYKQRWRGGQLRYADRWFPSSKTCSRCHHTRPVLGLAERVYRCPACGLVCDRDVNAAANLAAWAETATTATATKNR